MSVHFLSVVGASDPDGNPHSDVPLERNNGPLLATLFDHRGGLVTTEAIAFDRITLFCADRARESTFFDRAKEVQARVHQHYEALGEGPSVEVVRLEDCNPTDIEECMEKLREQLRSRVNQDDRVHVAVTPGAIGFQAAWYELSSWGLIPNARCWRALNPSFTGSRRVQPLDTNRNRRTYFLLQGLEAMDGHLYSNAARSFRAASERIGDISIPARVAEALACACEGVERWDVSDWQEAKLKLSEAVSLLSEVPEASALRAHILALDTGILRGQESEGVLAQKGLMRSGYAFYGSLSRCFEQGDFDRLATRARSCFERIVKSYASAHREVLNRMFGSLKAVPQDAQGLLSGEGTGAYLFVAHRVYADAAKRKAKLPERAWQFPEVGDVVAPVLNDGFWSGLLSIWRSTLWTEASDSGETDVTLAQVLNNSSELHFGRPPLNTGQAEAVMEAVQRAFGLVAGVPVGQCFPPSRSTLYGAESYRKLTQLARELVHQLAT